MKMPPKKQARISKICDEGRRRVEEFACFIQDQPIEESDAEYYEPEMED